MEEDPSLQNSDDSTAGANSPASSAVPSACAGIVEQDEAVAGSAQALPATISAPIQPAESIEPSLSAEQKTIYDTVMSGKSLFFTGSAGVGKSVLTRAIIKALKAKYGPQDKYAVGVTATTGIAAINIAGCTLHSWAGCGLAKLPAERLFYAHVLGKDWKKNKAAMAKEKTASRRASSQQDMPMEDEPDSEDATSRYRGDEEPVPKENQVYRRWTECKALIIDEGKTFWLTCVSYLN